MDAESTGHSRESALIEAVEAWQMDDNHYEVRLLPEYLFRLPESARPATFQDCAALLCVQQVYYRNSPIYRYRSSNMFYGRTYYPAFFALDVITVYGMQEPDISCSLYWQGNPPQVDDDEWFTLNKDSKSINVISNQYLLGEFDTDALMEYLDTYWFLIELMLL